MLALVLLSAPAAAAALDMNLAFDGGPTVTVRAAEVEPGAPLPVVIQPQANGDELVVTANVLGVVDGEAVVQVDASWRRACCDNLHLGVVLRGSETLDQVLPEGDGRAAAKEWLELSLVQEGVLEDTVAGAWDWSLVLPREAFVVTWGDVAEAVAPAARGMAGDIDVAGSISWCTARSGGTPMITMPRAVAMADLREVPEVLRGLLLLYEARPFGKRRLAESAQCRLELPDGDDIELDFTVRWL